MENLLDVVRDINYYLEDTIPELYNEYGITCQYRSNGEYGIIEFLDSVIWDEDNCCDREQDALDKFTETIEEYVKRKINLLIKGLQNIHFKEPWEIENPVKYIPGDINNPIHV